jgi:hypothetical protein
VKKGKTAGMDAMPIEFLKLLMNTAVKELVDLSNIIYRRGNDQKIIWTQLYGSRREESIGAQFRPNLARSLCQHAAKLMMKISVKRLEADVTTLELLGI